MSEQNSVRHVYPKASAGSTDGSVQPVTPSPSFPKWRKQYCVTGMLTALSENQ